MLDISGIGKLSILYKLIIFLNFDGINPCGKDINTVIPLYGIKYLNVVWYTGIQSVSPE